jgi:hypothetical protein
MKKYISLLAIILVLNLLLPIEQAAADRSSGGGGSSRGTPGGGGAYRGGYPGHGGNPRGHYGHPHSRHYGPGGSPRHYGHPYRYYGHGGGHYYGYPGYGFFLPGLVIGGILGWSLAPRYYTPPPYYYGPPVYGYPPDYATPPPAQEGQAPPTGGQLSIYPRQGQTQEQQDRDHTECHDWAVGQAGFDPYEPPPDQRPGADAAQKSARYLQALEACLDMRGYTLR